MMQWLCYLLPPLVALLIARAGRGGKRPAVFALAQGGLYAFLTAVAVALAMLPMERAAMRVFWDGRGGSYLYVHYGAAAMLLSGAVGVLLGVLSRLAAPHLAMRAQVLPREKHRHTAGRVLARALVHLLTLVLLLLTFSFAWGLGNYGNTTFEEMVFHLNVPLKGTSVDLIESYLRHAVAGALLAFAALEALVWWPSRRVWRVQSARCRELWAQVFPLRLPVWGALAALVLWLAVLLLGADQCFAIADFIDNQLHQSAFIQEHYVDPQSVGITFPEEKRNLITIFVESAETSAQDRANGGMFEVNYIPEMTAIAREGVSFSHSDKLEGAAVAPACGWTIAGLVAQTAGLPLKLYGHDDQPGGVDNSLGDFAAFMPGATSLGEILRDAGYRRVFMAGSDFTFGGRRAYYAQHGDYEILDYLVASESGRLPPPYYFEGWGFEDEKLYDWAREELTALAASGEPFHFAMLTVDSHSPDGYLCRLCPDTYDEQYANVLACTSAQLDSFIRWCQAQPFYENTTIVITGDHVSMQEGFYAGESSKYAGNVERKVYNAFLNSAVEPVREEGRMFTTMDFFPTTLASLGVTIEGERLGLGTNLFSDQATLAEEYGYETMFSELSRTSVFYNNEILYP